MNLNEIYKVLLLTKLYVCSLVWSFLSDLGV
jgi:hypothetical protein